MKLNVRYGAIGERAPGQLHSVPHLAVAADIADLHCLDLENPLKYYKKIEMLWCGG